ncbi:MAG: mRNA surveillance protein pelota [Thermoplasmata archaeon]|nr:mRNA surveillance protein pelota [Thermoplasmata archaeon]
MRIKHKDYSTGEISLKVQSLDDLWHLYNIVETGDLVFALTARREEARADAIRSDRGEKKKMRLGIRVEKTEFHEFANWLRIHGTIEEGPQDISAYHTLNITIDEDMSIRKTWTKHQLDILQQAEKCTERPLITIIAIDDEEAAIAQLREYGVKKLGTIQSGRSGKFYSQKAEKSDDYFDEIIQVITSAGEPGPIIIIGPGFAKEAISTYGRQKNPKIFEESQLISSGQSGMEAIQEILKKGIGSKTLEDSRVGMETRLVEQLLAEIGKDGLFAYGKAEVSGAVDAGAVDILLVTSTAARTRKFEAIMEKAGESNAKIVVVSEHNDAGKKLEALGEIGAILRYKIS